MRIKLTERAPGELFVLTDGTECRTGSAFTERGRNIFVDDDFGNSRMQWRRVK